MAMLYGGIDSKEVTERATDPSGAMGAIQRILSNDVACKHTAARLRPPARRAPAVPRHRAGRPARRLRRGRRGDPPGDRRTCTSGSWAATTPPIPPRSSGRSSCSPASSPTPKEQKGLDKRENYSCRPDVPDAPADPHYTIRAWRGVVTYLLRRPEFLYE